MNMRNVEDIIINKAIVHILNNKDEQLILNDFELDIDRQIEDLLKSHITNSINDEKTRVAKFLNETNVVRDYCQQILNDTSCFVKKSQEISRYLYDAMKQQNISPANFIICLYSAHYEMFIALLKMDFNDVFETETRELDDGKMKISIAIRNGAIPNKNQKLQKCVFFKTYASNNDYDIILLDKQAAKSNKDQLVADFFINNFLHCELSNNNTDNTKNFYKYAAEFINKVFKNDSDKAETARSTLINSLKTQSAIDIDTFSRQTFGDDDKVIEKFKSLISEKIGDFSISIDSDWVNRKLRKKKITTNSGIELKMEIDTAEDIDKFEIKHYSGKEEVDIVIKNVTYNEKITS